MTKRHVSGVDVERWKEIYNFPGYSISSLGAVRNDRTNRLLKPSQNREGFLYVGFFVDQMQYKRSISTLVAEAFLEEPMNASFDTPIHLDGDRSNNNVDNLMWRPRWFAITYRQQIQKKPRIVHSIIEIDTGERFSSSIEAAMRFGLLDSDVGLSAHTNKPCWPSKHRFMLNT